MNVSRSVHAEIELLFDITRATRPGDYDEVRRPPDFIRVPLRPMGQSPVE